ncbi:MAG: ABC transporter ATP-binding protein [Ornithinimicrobium sp.]|uniref:ABC transporter ATP-binding protein n=1 Tax=Ornithinimicrobium sp. TaxID=1977084 RepID=UPI0026DF9A54|nr:ABC transporter ATP-binding protein [Ornithinimicrobium sp.]MDO5740154.1 ABC transporter ATP-binding protein [Ornithinimicrobium sp.]
MNDVVLDVQGLVKRFGKHLAVDDVSFQIAPAETFGLIGPNGAGKTTTISMIAGLLQPDEGSVIVAGQTVSRTSIKPKRHIGLVPQDLAIYPELSARENLRFFGRLQGLRGKELRSRVQEVLELIGLADRAKEQSKKFSGGMKRRLNIGVGLLHRPDLLILDEPTVGVDPQSRNSILESVEALTTVGMAVLYTTHYMEEAERLCDRIAIIDSGKIQASGTQSELIDLTGGVDTIRLRGGGEVAAAEVGLRDLSAVQHVHRERGELVLSVHGAPTAIAPIVNVATGAGMTLSDVEITRPDLESVFLALTGKALRD